MKKFREISEQHREKGRFKPTVPHNVSSTPGGTPRETSDSANVKLREAIKDKFDIGEYDQEGDMAKSDLRSILANAKRVHDMLEDSDNLPEWVQSKITKAEDYLSTVANYMEAEMNEEAGASKKQETAFHKKLDSLVHKTFGKRKEEMKEAVKMPKQTRAEKEYRRITGKTVDQRLSELDKIQKDLAKQREDYIKQGIIKAEEVELDEASTSERKAINNVHKGFYDKVSKSKLKKVSKIGSDTYFVKSRSIYDPHESHFKTASGKYGSSMHSSEGGVPSHQEIHKDIKNHNPHLSKDEVKSAADVVHAHMSKNRLGEEVELDEAVRHEIAGQVARFIGNKIDPVHGDIMHAHGKEAYRQAAYHIRKTVHHVSQAVSDLHDRLHKHLRTGTLTMEEIEELDELNTARLATKGEYQKSLKTLEKMPEFKAMSKSLKRRDQDAEYDKRKNKEFIQSLKKEEVEELDELKTSTLIRYGTKATQSANKLNDDPAKREKRESGIERSIQKIKQRVKEEVEELDEGKYGGTFRVRMTSGGPKLPRRGYSYVPQGDKDPRTGLPLGFSHPPQKDEPKKVKEEVEQIDEISADVAKRVAQARDRSAVANKVTPTQSRRGINPDMNAAKALKSAMKRGAKNVYGEEVESLEEKNVPTSPEKWARAKAQAKAKFDVYPSAYANGWAAKKYKEMGGGWKSVNEEVEELDEDLKKKLAAAGIAASMALSPAAHARVTPGGQSVAQQAVATQKAPEQKKASVPSKSYLQTVASGKSRSIMHPDTAKELLKKHYSEEVDLDEGYFKSQETERQETERLEPPFTPDKPKKKSVVVGKKPEGYSRARQLARQAIPKPVKEAKEMSRKAKIVKDAMKKSSDDTFQAKPELSDSVTRNL